MLFTERLKKYIALGLAVSVMSIGILSANTSQVSAAQAAPTTVVSQDGKDVTVSGGGINLHVSKKDNLHATIAYTNSKGKKQNIQVTVTPLPDQKYQIETLDQGEKHVVIGDSNPLDDKKMIGLQSNVSSVSSVSSPDVLISFLVLGHADYYTLISIFGLALADKIMTNWGALQSVLASGGYWAVFGLLMSWEIVGAAVVLGALA